MTYRGFGNPLQGREFVVQAVRSEFKRQFARSSLGALWLILHPLARATIFAVVFSEIIVVRMPGLTNPYAYTIYLMAGMAAWGLFNDVVTRTATIFVDYGHLMKKIPMPHACFPAIAWGGALVGHALLLAASLVALVMLGGPLGPSLFMLIPCALLIVLLAGGLGIVLGVLQVFRRDVAQLTGIVLQVLFWLTPIVYSAQSLPVKYRWLMDLNPVVPFVTVYQRAMLYDAWPDYGDLAVPIAIAFGIMAAGLFLLSRAGTDVVDSL